MMKENLEMLYLNDQQDLCFKLMEGQGIKVLDLDLDDLRHDQNPGADGHARYFSHGMKINGVFNTINCTMFYEGHNSKLHASEDDEMYEIAFYTDDGGKAFNDLEGMLKSKNLSHLNKYISEEGYCGTHSSSRKHKSLCYIPKKHVLELIFAKGNDDNYYKSKQ